MHHEDRSPPRAHLVIVCILICLFIFFHAFYLCQASSQGTERLVQISIKLATHPMSTAIRKPTSSARSQQTLQQDALQSQRRLWSSSRSRGMLCTLVFAEHMYKHGGKRRSPVFTCLWSRSVHFKTASCAFPRYSRHHPLNRCVAPRAAPLGEDVDYFGGLSSCQASVLIQPPDSPPLLLVDDKMPTATMLFIQ